VNPRELAMADEARSRLGRGLASLIGDVGGEAAHLDRPRAQRKVPIEFLKPNPRNPRREFADAELGELADSIRQHGVIQPIVVRPVKGVQDRFEIIAGERRWRAAQAVGLKEIPVRVITASDQQALEMADYLRRNGPFEPGRLPMEDMEYTTMPAVAARLANRWEPIEEPTAVPAQ